MATDVEESDTDEHERPVSPKRQCTRLSKVNETCWNMEHYTSINSETKDDNFKSNDYDKIERHAREKLKKWQAFQAARGTMDNTVNKVLEDMMSSNHLVRDSLVNSLVYKLHSYQRNNMELFGIPLHIGNYMEDIAVMMAIHNHGLVKSAKLVSQPYNDKTSDYQTDSKNIDVHCSFPSSHLEDINGLSTTAFPTTSSDSLRPSNFVEMGRYNTDLDADKIYDSDQPEDFLERAVAEAIKKKGLSALSSQNY